MGLTSELASPGTPGLLTGPGGKLSEEKPQQVRWCWGSQAGQAAEAGEDDTGQHIWVLHHHH